MAEGDLDQHNFDVYDTKRGLWNPEHGALELPEGWDFLPSGDAFLTRSVKAGGSYWVVYRPRGRNRPHRRLLGLFAPVATIEAARTRAAESAERRAKSREAGGRQRARAEKHYTVELEDAIVAFLGFRPEHEQLARDIAREATERAAVVGSGRVGRTRKLPLEERAGLAARAYVRHRYTDYEDRLDRVPGGQRGELDDDRYYEIKRDAQVAVDRFLENHRGPSTGPGG